LARANWPSFEGPTLIACVRSRVAVEHRRRPAVTFEDRGQRQTAWAATDDGNTGALRVKRIEGIHTGTYIS
jgi:hypothetical protein